MTWRVLEGDAAKVLRRLPAESIQCVVTSPPYYGLRQYLHDGAVILRRDLDEETRDKVIAELTRHGIRPR